jgi:hypothetical protein
MHSTETEQKISEVKGALDQMRYVFRADQRRVD